MAIGAFLGKVPENCALPFWAVSSGWRLCTGEAEAGMESETPSFVLAALWALWLAVTDVRFGRKLFESSFFAVCSASFR